MASTLAGMASLSVAAFVFLPKGMAAFAVMLVLATVVASDLLARAWKTEAKIIGSLAMLSAGVACIAIVSMQITGQGWNTVDNYARFLLMPWCAALAFALSPSRQWLWLGAAAGVLIAFASAAWEMWSGADRAGVGDNPIVFANAVLALLVLVIYCRPRERNPWVITVVASLLLLGTAAIVMSGSRGAMPGLGVLILVAAFGSGGRLARRRLGFSLLALLLFLALLCSVPWLTAHMRLENIPVDLQEYSNGQVDSAIGARLQFLSLAWHAFLEHPLMGVGIDRFGTLVRHLPECQAGTPTVCTLGHAHNDVAQWSATMGLPGLTAILALYMVPAFLFLRIIIKFGQRQPLGSAWAGLLLVVAYALSGLTQSMFAHATSTTLYAALVGILMGLALYEARLTRASASVQGA